MRAQGVDCSTSSRGQQCLCRYWLRRYCSEWVWWQHAQLRVALASASCVVVVLPPAPASPKACACGVALMSRTHSTHNTQTCQALGVDGRSPISLERYQRAVADCDSFAAWLSDYQAQVTAVKNATLQGGWWAGVWSAVPGGCSCCG